MAIRVLKVPYCFLGKLKNEIEKNTLSFLFSTNNGNGNLEYFQLLYV